MLTDSRRELSAEALTMSFSSIAQVCLTELLSSLVVGASGHGPRSLRLAPCSLSTTNLKSRSKITYTSTSINQNLTIKSAGPGGEVF